jgi:hypothetical protein
MLPNELYSKILNELLIQNWGRMRLISQRFYSLINLLQYLKLIKLSSLNRINLKLTSLKTTDHQLIHLNELTSLTQLDLVKAIDIRDDDLIHLKKLINLTHLNLSGCSQITDEGLSHLKQLKLLTRLHFNLCIESLITDYSI